MHSDEEPGRPDTGKPLSEHFEHTEEGLRPEEVQAWVEAEPGRFMPRRVRGSCVGRALG